MINTWYILLEQQGRLVLRRPIDTLPFIIGRDPQCTLELLDEDVSRRHCTVEWRDGILVARDHSRNGTMFNGTPITTIPLADGDRLAIGRWTLHLVSTEVRRTEETVIPTSSSKRTPPQMFGAALGVSPAMKNIFSLIERIAPSSSTILVSGESGTGKELMARVIHEHSTNPSGPFVAVNCGALPPTMIEAILFGHERGAFTGAIDRAAGVFEQAHDGSLFLDEIGEMPLDMQTRLLRALEEGKIRRLGGRSDVEINVRLIAATNRDLVKLVAEEKFRTDLFYRLYVVPVHLPPLRQRPEDIEPLAQHFIARFTPPGREIVLTPAAIEKLRQHTWPGNVRELKNAMQRSILISATDLLDADAVMLIAADTIGGDDGKLFAVERTAIIAALKRTMGNCSQVARELGIARTTLAAKMRRHTINPNDFRK